MTNKNIDQNNQANVIGEIISGFEYSHEVFGEKFYFVKLRVSRLSDSQDIIPLLVSDRMMDVRQPLIGQVIQARGQFRSYNQRSNERSHLMLSLFVKDIVFLGQEGDCRMNSIFLDGYICKKPHYRTTPSGREIADVLIAVNRSYSKSDYIPCILWGRNARYSASLSVGSRIKIWGRIQSRDYCKRVSENDIITRVAYEISVHRVECEEEYIQEYSQVADSVHGYAYC